MRYLGLARNENGKMAMPDAFKEVKDGQLYEAVEIDGDVILLPNPLDRERLASVERLAKQSIADHRKTLEGLAG